MAPSILVTGASGFVGRQVLQPLVQRGFHVHAISREARHNDDDITWHACNLLQHEETAALIATIRPSHLLHTAWVTQHGVFWNSPENTAWLEASKALCTAFAQHGGKHVIALGSCAEYDWNRSYTARWKESDPCTPHTPYGAAKHAFAQWLIAFSREAQLRYVWARLFLLFGAGETPERIVPYLIRTALENGVAECSSGTQIRDFLDTATCGTLLAKIAASNLRGTMNLASGQGISLKELAARITALTQRDAQFRFGAVADRAGEPPYMVADMDMLHTVYPQPSYDLDTALMEAIRYWQGKSCS